MMIVETLLSKITKIFRKSLEKKEKPKAENPITETDLFKKLGDALRAAAKENNLIAMKTILTLQGILLDKNQGKMVTELQFDYLLQLFYKQRCFNENFEKEFMENVIPQGNA
jgi:hypothetical protein